MTLNIYVHPGHRWSAKEAYPAEHVFPAYQREIRKLPGRSTSALLVSGGHDLFFAEQIPKTHQIRSINYHDDDTVEYWHGLVDPSDWEKYRALIDANKGDIRVHGAYLEQCVHDHAIQLFGYLQYREHWHNWVQDVEVSYAVRKNEIERIKEHEKKGNFQRSRIRYGIVLRHPGGSRTVRPPQTRMGKMLCWLLGGLPFGNIDYQFIDERTRIFGE